MRTIRIPPVVPYTIIHVVCHLEMPLGYNLYTVCHLVHHLDATKIEWLFSVPIRTLLRYDLYSIPFATICT